jgi:carbamoyltransferase
MITWGISANSHNAAIAVFKDQELVFASETERWSKIKNDPNLSHDLVYYLNEQNLTPDRIVWYERPLLKSLRQFKAGQGITFKENNIKQYLQQYIPVTKLEYAGHHHSHAAAGYYTSGFDEACVLVIDSIGEFETISIWHGKGTELTKKWSMSYPYSMGLFYSAMTQRIGLKPNEEEYIMMGMAAYGDDNKHVHRMYNDFFEGKFADFKMKRNLHRGCLDWAPELGKDDYFDIAAAAQTIYEDWFDVMLVKARLMINTDNLVLMGGCALNCSANRFTGDCYFDNVWIMPAPGDSGSAIGAVLAKDKFQLEWRDSYLGYDISPKTANDVIVTYLEKNKICGLARGPAEFGPRALGNRSLLADPRGPDIKDKVNEIKHREPFRPFAPAILEELVHDYFDMPPNWDRSRYMQVVANCRVVDQFPAIVHIDGTSRVQTVPNDGSPFRQLLELWYAKTGCPMLLNTSLNIKGQPMVNDLADAKEWERLYGVKVFS